MRGAQLPVSTCRPSRFASHDLRRQYQYMSNATSAGGAASGMDRATASSSSAPGGHRRVRGVVPPGDNSGVGVLDKAVSVLAAVESGPATLAQLVSATGLARPTTHRIAVALEHHRLLARDVQGRFILGPRVAELASAAGEDRLLAVSQPVLNQLRD